MPIQAPQWTDYLNCPACCREFSPRRSPVSLSCGHTLCRPCLKNLLRKQCPFDQSVISMDLEELVVNTALLQLMGYDPPAQPTHPPNIQRLSEQDRRAYDIIVKSLEQLAVFLKYCCTASVNMIGSRLSRPMQRKLVTLLQCALMDEEGRGKAARAARSLGERTVSELILQHQNPQQLSANLWAAVRARGCQFLGPAMQEEVLKLVLLALEDGSALSRKVLVMFVVQRLEPHFPQASKTSIGHVVQLLYRASCFKVSKRESDSSLMQLKEEFRTYECLRREHDAQIVQIATEAGLRIAPDQWSALLYGDTLHKSHMQSIIDKLQTPHSFAQSVQELFFALQRTGDPAQLIVMGIPLDRLTSIDSSPDARSPSWQELSEIMTALKDVVSGLVDYMQHHAMTRDANHNQKTDRLPDASTQPATIPGPGRYKVAMCRDAQIRTFCPRGNNCTYAHTEEELERYRRQDAHNESPMFTGSPQTILAPQPLIAVPLFAIPAPRPDTNYNMMAMQMSPSAHQHGVTEMTDEYNLEHVHRNPSFERQQFECHPPNQRGNFMGSYANALMFGAPDNRQHQNDGLSPLNGIRHHNGGISPLGGPMIHLNDGLSPLNGGIGPLDGVMGPNNGGMDPYNGGLNPIGEEMHQINGGIPRKHEPPSDSRFFPRRTFVKPPQCNRPIGTKDKLPDFALQPYEEHDGSELPNIESFGLGTGTISRFETSWQSAVPPPLPANNAPKRAHMFKFNDKAKNLPIGIGPQDRLPMGINLINTVPRMDITNVPIGSNYLPSSANFNQPMMNEPNATPSMMDMPGPSNIETEEVQNCLENAINNLNEQADINTNEVLEQLHDLAVRITSECSDSDTEIVSE